MIGSQVSRDVKGLGDRGERWIVVMPKHIEYIHIPCLNKLFSATSICSRVKVVKHAIPSSLASQRSCCHAGEHDQRLTDTCMRRLVVMNHLSISCETCPLIPDLADKLIEVFTSRIARIHPEIGGSPCFQRRTTLRCRAR